MIFRFKTLLSRRAALKKGVPLSPPNYDDDVEALTDESKGILENILDSFPKRLCFRLTGGSLRCLRERRSRSSSINPMLSGSPSSTI